MLEESGNPGRIDRYRSANTVSDALALSTSSLRFFMLGVLVACVAPRSLASRRLDSTLGLCQFR